MEFVDRLKNITRELLFPYDSIFETLIEKEFRPDLRLVMEYSSIPDGEISSFEQDILFDLRRKYRLGCPSKLYGFVSSSLKERYQDIHSAMNLFLNN